MWPNTSVTQSEKKLLVTQVLWLERQKTDVFKRSGVLRMVHDQWFYFAVPRSIGTEEQRKPARQVGLLLRDIGSAWHSLPEKGSFVAVKHLLRNKASLVNYFLKFLTMLLNSVPISTSSLTTLCNPVLFLNQVNHPLVPKNSFRGPVLVQEALAPSSSNNCLAFSQTIASLTQ